MATMRRAIALLALALATVLGVSAFTASALAYPPGQKAHVTLSADRVDPGATVTISGANFRPKGNVKITIVCRGSSDTKRFTATYNVKASGGTFSKAIDTTGFPSGRCRLTAKTGKQALNSDNATFFINPTGKAGDSTAAVKLASVSGTPSAGSGSSWGAVFAGGLSLAFLLGGGSLLLAGRRKHAIVR